MRGSGAAVAFLLLAGEATAQDWPQWRGPNRDGVVPGLPPADWPAALSLLWERDVGGGYSGPIAAGGRVWVHARRADREVVTCLRLATGEVLWSREYPAAFRQDDEALVHGSGPYATPALDGKRLFTTGIRSVLSAWDADSGALLWRKASRGVLGAAFPYFGMAASPLVWRGLCFIHLGGHRRSILDASDGGAMVAFRASDGQEMWRWSGDAPSVGSSPVLGVVSGQPQLVFKTQRYLVGLDPLRGTELWRMPYQPYRDNTIGTPLLTGDRLLTSDDDLGVKAWRIQTVAGQWAARELWHTRDASEFTTSSIPVAGLVMGFSQFRKGQLFLLDPARGAVVWRGPARGGEHATILGWADHALVFDQEGYLTVGAVRDQSFHTLRRYRLCQSGTWAHPAVAGNRIVIRDGIRLAAYGIGHP